MTTKKPLIKRLRWDRIIKLGIVVLAIYGGIELIKVLGNTVSDADNETGYYNTDTRQKITTDVNQFETIEFKEGYVKKMFEDGRIVLEDAQGNKVNVHLNRIAFFRDLDVAMEFTKDALNGKDFKVVMVNDLDAEVYVDNNKLADLLIGLGVNVTASTH